MHSVHSNNPLVNSLKAVVFIESIKILLTEFDINYYCYPMNCFEHFSITTIIENCTR